MCLSWQVLETASLKLIERKDDFDEDAYEVAFPIESLEEAPTRGGGRRRERERHKAKGEGKGGRGVEETQRPVSGSMRFDDDDDVEEAGPATGAQPSATNTSHGVLAEDASPNATL